MSVLYLDQKLLEIIANFNIDPIICDFDKEIIANFNIDPIICDFDKEIIANFNIDPIICDFDKDLSKFAEWLNGQYG